MGRRKFHRSRFGCRNIWFPRHRNDFVPSFAPRWEAIRNAAEIGELPSSPAGPFSRFDLRQSKHEEMRLQRRAAADETRKIPMRPTRVHGDSLSRFVIAVTSLNRECVSATAQKLSSLGVWIENPNRPVTPGVLNESQAKWLIERADEMKLVEALAVRRDVLAEALRAPAWFLSAARSRAAKGRRCRARGPRAHRLRRGM